MHFDQSSPFHPVSEPMGVTKDKGRLKGKQRTETLVSKIGY